MHSLYTLSLAQRGNVCTWGQKANVNASSALAGWRHLDNPITAGWVSQEAASETDVSVPVFIIREYHWTTQLWRKGRRMGRAEIQLRGKPDSLSHSSGSSGARMFL